MFLLSFLWNYVSLNIVIIKKQVVALFFLEC